MLIITPDTSPLCDQVGTEANPFPEQYTATIKLYGHIRSRELPIYGTKVLALREGTLDLHGHPTPVTWTTLSTTANAGDTQITLTTPVNWKVHTCCLTLFFFFFLLWSDHNHHILSLYRSAVQPSPHHHPPQKCFGLVQSRGPWHKFVDALGLNDLASHSSLWWFSHSHCLLSLDCGVVQFSAGRLFLWTPFMMYEWGLHLPQIHVRF